MSLKIASKVKELRLHLCQVGKQSAGVRDFITTQYVSIKQQNPTLPILIRECRGVQPRLWARYEKGKESSVPLTDLDCNGVMEAVKKLVA